MEPFLTANLWGNLTDDNAATLVSAGVNFFNFSQPTAVFAKVDVSFGDDLTGVGGKGACSAPG